MPQEIPCKCVDEAWGACPRHGKKLSAKQPPPVEADIAPALSFSSPEPNWAPVDTSEIIVGAGGVTTLEGESILQEAHRLTHGPRQKDYGHPLDDYTRTAALASALLAHKLKEPVSAMEMSLLMVCVKLSRQINHPKRDNMTDGAGYCWVAQECIDEAARRSK